MRSVICIRKFYVVYFDIYLFQYLFIKIVIRKKDLFYMFLYINNENNYMYYKYGYFYNIFNLKVNWLRVVLECKIKGVILEVLYVI